MADLARSVSHGLNNALGSMLPLIQQMQADLPRRSGNREGGPASPEREARRRVPFYFLLTAALAASTSSADHHFSESARCA
jgi:hypothetical protein